MEDSDFQATRDAQKEWNVVFIGSIYSMYYMKDIIFLYVSCEGVLYW